MGQETEVKNAALTLASIRSDTVLATKELSEIYAKRDAALEEGILADAEMAEKRRLLKEEEEALAEERRQVAQERVQAERIVARSKEELEILNRQKNTAMTELHRLNDWIFTAEATKKALETDIAELEIKQAEKDSYLIDIEVYKAKKDEAETAYKDVLLSSKLVSDDALEVVKKAQNELKTTSEQLEIVKKALEIAEIELFDKREEKHRIEVEIQVIIKRVQDKYEEMFPGAKLKL